MSETSTSFSRLVGRRLLALRGSAIASSSKNGLSSYVLFFVIAAAPFPFGSTDRVAIAFWCICLGCALATLNLSALRREHLFLITVILTVVLGYAFVLHEQLAMRPWVGKPDPLWSKSSEILGTKLSPSVAIVRDEPYFALGAPLLNVLSVFCSFVVCLDRARAKQLLCVVGLSGAAYAAYGIAAYLLDPHYVLWREKLGHREVLTATFLNRNTAGVYFGSCAVIWQLAITERLHRRLPSRPLSVLELFRFVFSPQPVSVIASTLMWLLCLSALLLTNSRAGIVLSLLLLVVAFVCYFFRELHSGARMALSFLAGTFFIASFLQVLGGSVGGRFDVEGLSDEGRVQVYWSTLKLIAGHPWFGTGLGTFSWSFPAYRPDTISMYGVWDRAHNTPLELAAELGIPLATLVALAWVAAASMLLRGIRRRRYERAVPAAAFSVGVLAVLHSCIDFSLQIPGYSIVVFALVGAGLAQSFSSRRAEKGG